MGVNLPNQIHTICLICPHIDNLPGKLISVEFALANMAICLKLPPQMDIPICPFCLGKSSTSPKSRHAFPSILVNLPGNLPPNLPYLPPQFAPSDGICPPNLKFAMANSNLPGNHLPYLPGNINLGGAKICPPPRQFRTMMERC